MLCVCWMVWGRKEILQGLCNKSLNVILHICSDLKKKSILKVEYLDACC